MNEENKITQDPPVKTAKVAEYFVDLYNKSGYDLDEKKALGLASSSDLKKEISRQHRILALPVPEATEIDSIFGSFVEQTEVEKKNLLQNTISVLESSSVLEEKDFSSDSGRNLYQVSLDEDPIGTEKIFRDALSRIDMNVFSMNGSDASILMDKELGFYGFKFSPSSTFDSKVKITAPDGESKEFRLFTEEYRNKAFQTEDISQLAQIRLDQMRDFIISKSNASVIDNVSAVMINSTEENIIDNISSIIGKYDKEVLFDLADAISSYKDNFNINDYLTNGILDRSKASKALDDIRSSIISKSDKFNLTETTKIDSATEKFNINKSNVASILSSVLSKTGAYKKINVNDPEKIKELERIGISAADIPIDAIKVNGVARSLNYLTSNILYDFEKVQAIRDGKISIDIGDDKTAGVLAPYVQRAKRIVETQKAYSSKNAGKSLLRFMEETGEIGLDALQAVGISILEIPTNLGYVLYDSMRAIGVSEEAADLYTYGALGLAGFSGIRPENIDYLRTEYIPRWNGSYLDSGGFQEFIARGSQDFANSAIHTAMFMIPGGQAVALSNVAISSYANDRMNFERLRRDIDDKRKRGYVLTEEETNLLNTSDNKARLISIGKAATETAVTKAFTGNFFKRYQKLHGVRSKIESQYGSIADFNRVYAGSVRNDFIGLFKRYTGISGRALSTEIPEEEIIAFTNYTSDVVFGFKKWDAEEARNLFLNTGISSVFTSVAMGKIASYGTNSRARKLAVDIVSKNLSLPQERSLVTEKILVDTELALVEDKIISDGKNPIKDNYFNVLKNKSLDLSDRINRIDEEKRRIAEQMPSAEKVEFLELMQSIEQIKKSAEGATDLGKQSAIEQQIKDLRERGRKIVSKYPSELSYYFADDATRSKFKSDAITQLSSEAEARGEEFNLNSEDDVVLQRASELYNQNLKDKNEAQESNYNAFEAFGTVKLPEIPTTASEDDKLKDVQSVLFNLKQVSEGGITLDDLTTTDVLTSPFNAQQFIQSTNESDLPRLNTIYSRMVGLDIGNISSQLSEKDKSTIRQFRKDMEQNKRPQIGRLEAMLDAMEATNAIYAKSGGKIQVSGVVDQDGTITEKGINKLNDVIKSIYANFNLSTKDVLARTLFRDREVGAPFIDIMNEAFRSSAEGENKSKQVKKSHLDSYKKDGGGDPNSIDNSYELFMLGALKREVDIIDPSGQNAEFVRAKRLILDELEIRRRESEADPSNKVLKFKYDRFKNIADKLDINNATSYTDVASKASQANKNAIDALASIMPGERAFERINDFESYAAFKYKEGTYVPMFMSKQGEAYSDYFGHSNSSAESIAGSLKNVTRPDALLGDVRLNPEMFFDNAYKAYRGMEMDILAKKHFETLDYMVNSPRFQNMIEGKSKKSIINSFKNLKATFEGDVRRSESNILDMESLSPNDKESATKAISRIWGKTTSAAYGFIGSVSLARWSQRASQYYGAQAGGVVYLKNPQSKTYLGSKAWQFTFGAGRYFDKSRSGMAIQADLTEFIKHKDAQLGNIYMKSRTGLRNSLLADLAVDSGKKVPISYYVSRFGIDPSKQNVIEKLLGTTATVDSFLDFAIKSNELTLNLWLGSADRLAANHIFEAAYLDYRLSNGADTKGDVNAWFLNENKNPDLAAIRYADEVVAKSMRQTGQASEAEVYSQTSKVKNTMRLLFPFSKFVMNAKGDIANNLSIILDPNIPQSQKQLSENVLLGRASEIFAYNAIKFTATKLTVNGVISLFGLAGAEEEDIQEYGGMTSIIAKDVLPIVSKEDFDPKKINISEAKTWEEYQAVLQAQAGFTEIEGISKEFKTYSRTFEDKFQTQGNYSVLGPTVQDLVMTMNPLPTPDVFEDILADGFNSMWGEDVATEYISKDLEKANTLEGVIAFVAEKSGLASIGLEQANSLLRARNMAFDLEIRKYGGEVMPTVVEHLSAPTDAMREKLIGATQLLLITRWAALTLPAAPRADLDKFADKLERSIEKNFSGSNRDEKMHEIKGNFLFPMNNTDQE